MHESNILQPSRLTVPLSKRLVSEVDSAVITPGGSVMITSGSSKTRGSAIRENFC